MIHKRILVFLIAFLPVIISACSDDDDDDLIGSGTVSLTWTDWREITPPLSRSVTKDI